MKNKTVLGALVGLVVSVFSYIGLLPLTIVLFPSYIIPCTGGEQCVGSMAITGGVLLIFLGAIIGWLIDRKKASNSTENQPPVI